MEAVLAQSCKLAQLSYEVAPLSDDLNSQNVDQMMTLLFDEEGNVEFEINSVDYADFNEMFKLFYD